MSDEKRNTVDINYIKSNGFREIACDGVLGGPTPRGKIWLAFFTERLPLPRVVRHELTTTDVGVQMVDPDKPPTIIDSRAGVVRNVEFGLYLRVETARELYEWLGHHIDAVESGEGTHRQTP